LRAGEGLAVMELAIRTAMTRLGARLLEDLLALDAGYGGPAVDCGAPDLAGDPRPDEQRLTCPPEADHAATYK